MNYGYLTLLVYAVLNIIFKYDHNRKLEERFPQDGTPNDREMFTAFSGHFGFEIFFLIIAVFGFVKELVG